MLDYNLLLKLLGEMSKGDDGKLSRDYLRSFTEDDRNELHQLNLLVDAGHAEWLDRDNHIICATSEGRDFYAAIDGNLSLETKFQKSVIGGNVTYSQAAKNVMKFVRKSGRNDWMSM